jgi:tellurite resistance protein
MAHHPTPLNFLFPGGYAVVMGLAGLSLAWHRATPLTGEMAVLAAMVLGGLAATVFAALAVATVWRARRHPDAWQDDRRHAVRHAFIATLPLSVLLLAAVAARCSATAPGRGCFGGAAACLSCSSRSG